MTRVTIRVPREKGAKIRVFLVDPHSLVRGGVRAYLIGHSIDVVGEASDGQEALRKAKKLLPDVIVLDISLPAMDGGELALRLRKAVPKAKLIAFSIHSSEAYMVRMAQCGVHGYVVKEQPTGELLAAIETVFNGGRHFPVHERPDSVVLTEREIGVLASLGEELSDQKVAADHGISVRAVLRHRVNISRKLNILTALGLKKFAIAHGLTTPGSRKK